MKIFSSTVLNIIKFYLDPKKTKVVRFLYSFADVHEVAVLFNKTKTHLVKLSKVPTVRYIAFALVVSFNILPLLIARRFTSRSENPTNLTPTPTYYLTQLPASEATEDFIQAKKYSLNENILMNFINSERKKLKLEPFRSNDIEVCIVTQSTLNLVMFLNRVPTDDELKNENLGLINQRQIHLAEAVGGASEAQVVENFMKDEKVRNIITNRYFKTGCVKASFGFAVFAATY